MATGSTGNSDFPQGVWRNLYIHLPFCASKCGYCAFYSRTACSSTLRKKYLEAVKDFLKRCTFSEKLQSVYLGGGTPNFLTAGELADLLEFISGSLPLSEQCEISCELNPELLTRSKMSVLNEHVTRLSLGVQSFNSSVRKTLMRRCSDEHLQNALKLLQHRRAVHFNIDLIYGVSGVPWSIFENDLRCALEQGVDHISCYALTPEENSVLGFDAPADDDSAAVWWQDIGAFLSRHGLERYEISNYAVPGCECRHNMNVWSGDTLLGVGSAAAGFNGIDRYTFEPDIEAFTERGDFTIDHTGNALRILEIFAVNLRTVGGWTEKQWSMKYPGSWDILLAACKRAAENDPAKWCVTNDRIKLTVNGLLFWDDIAMDVLDWGDEFEK